jgi:hypothetical protein
VIAASGLLLFALVPATINYSHELLQFSSVTMLKLYL